MNRTYKTLLFTLFLGIFIVSTITANSLAENTNQKKLIELKDIYEKGGISEAEYKAAKKIFSSKEDNLDKKIEKEKKSFSLKNKPKKNIKLNLFKKSQKLIDRFLFVFFGEDRGLLSMFSCANVASGIAAGKAAANSAAASAASSESFAVMGNLQPYEGSSGYSFLN